jgi:AcrR family transcriptional regulator
VTRAVALADAEGLAAVTVRRLTSELGVTPMALYWHYRNKQALLDALTERVIGEFDLTVDETAPWREQLRSLLASMIQGLRAHPWGSELLTRCTAPSDAYLQALEVMLGILRRGGYSAEQAVHVARHAFRWALASATDEAGYVRQHDPGAPESDADAQGRTYALLRALPSDRYPNVVEAAAPLTTCDDPEADLAMGLDVLLAGIEATADQQL